MSIGKLALIRTLLEQVLDCYSTTEFLRPSQMTLGTGGSPGVDMVDATHEVGGGGGVGWGW